MSFWLAVTKVGQLVSVCLVTVSALVQKRCTGGKKRRRERRISNPSVILSFQSSPSISTGQDESLSNHVGRGCWKILLLQLCYRLVFLFSRFRCPSIYRILSYRSDISDAAIVSDFRQWVFRICSVFWISLWNCVHNLRKECVYVSVCVCVCTCTTRVCMYVCVCVSVCVCYCQRNWLTIDFSFFIWEGERGARSPGRDTFSTFFFLCCLC